MDVVRRQAVAHERVRRDQSLERLAVCRAGDDHAAGAWDLGAGGEELAGSEVLVEEPLVRWHRAGEGRSRRPCSRAASVLWPTVVRAE